MGSRGNNTSSQNNLPPSIPRSLQSPEVRDLSRAMSDDEGMGDGGFSPAYDDNEGGDYDIAEPEDPFEEHNVVDDVNGSHLVGRSISKSQPITQRQGAQGQEDTQRPADDDTIHDKVRESQNLGHSGIADQYECASSG